LNWGHAWDDDDIYDDNSDNESGDVYNPFAPAYREAYADDNKHSDDSYGTRIEDLLRDIDHCRAQTLKSIPRRYMNTCVMYLCRCFVSMENKYKYCIEFAENIEESLEMLDDKYTCSWQIEIIAIGDSRSQDEEVIMRYKLYKRGMHIKNDLYDLDIVLYEYFTSQADYTNPRYIVEVTDTGDWDEKYMGKKLSIFQHTKNSMGITDLN
jgi:hypothetical protein